MLEEEELKNAILMVLANKQDIPGCLSLAEVHKALGLEVSIFKWIFHNLNQFFSTIFTQISILQAIRNRTFQIFKTSATKGDGLDEAMEWLAGSLQAK